MTEKQLELLRLVSQILIDNRAVLKSSLNIDLDYLVNTLSEVEAEAFNKNK